MALIKCPECGKEISDQSKTCIHCGFPLDEKPKGKRNVVLIASLAVVIVVLLMVGIKLLNPSEPNDNVNQPSEIKSTTNTQSPEIEEMNTQSPEIEEMITQSKQNVEPYLDVMGADITNGNPTVSQDFIDNMNSVEIMGYVGSVEHSYNIYDERTYIELMTWESNKSTTNEDFFVFLGLMDEYFGQNSVLVSYDYIDDEIYGWVEPSKQFSMIAYFDGGKIFLQWDVRLKFEDEESLRVVESEDDYESSSGNDNQTNVSSATTGEKNALKKAKSYLNLMPFSYSGLIEQLEYEGFTRSEAVYGADHCGADWYEQAVKKAADYLDLMAFSRSGLIEQLEYEGYTHEQAVYGVEQNGY